MSEKNPRVRDQLIEGLRFSLSEGESGLRDVPLHLKAVLKTEAWREREIKDLRWKTVRYEKFSDFVTDPPLEGLGASLEVVRRLVRDDPEALDLYDRAVQGKHGGDRSKRANGPVGRGHAEGGSSRGRALRRLRKDRPDLHSRVLTGEISAHAAMLEAGFRKKPTVLETLLSCWKKATTEEKRLFLEAIHEATQIGSP